MDIVSLRIHILNSSSASNCSGGPIQTATECKSDFMIQPPRTTTWHVLGICKPHVKGGTTIQFTFFQSRTYLQGTRGAGPYGWCYVRDESGDDSWGFCGDSCAVIYNRFLLFVTILEMPIFLSTRYIYQIAFTLTCMNLAWLFLVFQFASGSVSRDLMQANVWILSDCSK